ncbi:MAG: hypothetical protein JW763_06175 [candidate division Zixibacteria bacterium]|nr:hypothetical protein [candidate division Zixibacteria bacterium]
MPQRMAGGGRGMGGGGLRRAMSGKSGKWAGFSAIAAPIIGFVVHDLTKPNSLIRGLVSDLVAKYRASHPRVSEPIDITDQVDIVDSDGAK